MAWKKGESGNPGGRTREKPFAEALRIALAEEEPATQKRKLRVIADKLVDAALDGDPWAIKEVIDRVDGKPTQSVDATIDDKRDVRDLSDAELRQIIEDRVTRIDELIGATAEATAARSRKLN